MKGVLEDKDYVRKSVVWSPLCTSLQANNVASPLVAESGEFKIPELSKTPIVEDMPQLFIDSYLYYYGGYAEFSREVIDRLSRKGYLVKVHPIPSCIDLDPFQVIYFKEFTLTPLDETKPILYLVITSPRFYECYGQKILWTMIETKAVHEDALIRCDDYDEVWVPTDLDMERFGVKESISRKLIKMPFGIDLNRFDPYLVKSMNIATVKNKFVFMFNGNWNKRKGIDIIIRAFCKAFESNSNVALILFSKYATRPYGVEEDNEERWTIKHEFNEFTKDFNKHNMPQICIIDVPVHESVVPSLMARADCGVGASLGESIWLPGLEFGALSIPIIQTEWGGFRDYLNDENSNLVRIKGFKKADDELVEGTCEYFEDQEFAIPDEDDLVDKMKDVYKNHENAKIKAEKLQQRVFENYNWKDVIQKVDKRLKEVINVTNL